MSIDGGVFFRVYPGKVEEHPIRVLDEGEDTHALQRGWITSRSEIACPRPDIHSHLAIDIIQVPKVLIFDIEFDIEIKGVLQRNG